MAKSTVKIPALGTVIELKKTVTVELLSESRNNKALEKLSEDYQDLERRTELASEEWQALRNEYYRQAKELTGIEYPNYWNRLKSPELQELHNKLVTASEDVRIKYGLPKDRYTKDIYYLITLPPGEYKIDRIYIRKSCEEFDSITLVNVEKKFRFWLKLDTFNSLKFSYKD